MTVISFWNIFKSDSFSDYFHFFQLYILNFLGCFYNSLFDFNLFIYCFAVSELRNYLYGFNKMIYNILYRSFYYVEVSPKHVKALIQCLKIIYWMPINNKCPSPTTLILIPPPKRWTSFLKLFHQIQTFLTHTITCRTEIHPQTYPPSSSFDFPLPCTG